MRCKVRYVSRQPGRGESYKEQVVDVQGRRVKLGRGTDNDVFLKDLRVNFRHADIVVRDTDAVVEAIGESPLKVDGVAMARGSLGLGTLVEVGPYRVVPIESEPGADLTLEVELLTPAPTGTVEQLVIPGGLRLEGTALGKRALSWALFLLVLVAGLGLPVAAYMSKAAGRAEATADRDGTGGGARPTLSFASIDRLWNPGELSSSHKFMVNRCEDCHDAAFAWVRAESCASCHDDVQHHFETAKFQFAGMDATGCTGCHGEHQGPTGAVPVQQTLCSGCHQDLDQHPGETKTTLANATDFGRDHPQLKASVIVDPANGRVRRAALPSPGAPKDPAFPAERSGLKFPHDVHMAKACEKPPRSASPAVLAAWPEAKVDACTVLEQVATRMRRPEGTTLGCGDCHQPDPSGVDMRPATMEDHCASCHRLQFDNAAPDRVLPHGEPDEVIAVINDYFAARASRGQPVVLKQDTGGRRRPGEKGAKVEAAAAPAAAPAGPAPQQQAQLTAAQRLDALFGKALCGYCHEVLSPAQSARKKWEVLPVRVAEVWMPKSVFDHAAHTTSECIECHKADASASAVSVLSAAATGLLSSSATDVLMPPIETCRKCHGGEEAIAEVPSTCTMCHVYHRDDLKPMFERSPHPAMPPVRVAGER